MNDPIRCSEFSCPHCQSRDLTYILIDRSTRTYKAKPSEFANQEEVMERWGPVRDYTCQNCEYEWSAQDEQTTEGQEPPGDIAVPVEDVA